MTESTERSMNSIMDKIEEIKRAINRDRFNLTDNDATSIAVKLDDVKSFIRKKYEDHG